MRKRKSLFPYAIAAAIGGAVTPWAIQCAALQRGQAGRIGGEYLIIPLLCLLVAIGKTIISIFMEYISDHIK
jgi:hypothetical protein